MCLTGPESAHKNIKRTALLITMGSLGPINRRLGSPRSARAAPTRAQEGREGDAPALACGSAAPRAPRSQQRPFHSINRHGSLRLPMSVCGRAGPYGIGAQSGVTVPLEQPSIKLHPLQCIMGRDSGFLLVTGWSGYRLLRLQAGTGHKWQVILWTATCVYSGRGFSHSQPCCF